MKRVKKIERITDFEETCMWMSYRYAIGRHSIGSLMHANDIAKNLFYRIPNDTKEFNSFDIAREIDNQLRYSFNFYIDFPRSNENYHPFELLIRFIKLYHIYDLNEFNKFASIKYNIEDDKFSVKYVDSYIDAYHSNPIGSEQKEQYEIKKNYSAMELNDLLPWQKLSACFDIKNLKVITTECNGSKVDYICFKSYYYDYGRKTEIDLQGNPYEVNDLSDMRWHECWISVDAYVNGYENKSIINDYITNIRDITPEEIKQFEGYN